jgi:hypothetical protein
MQRGLEPPRDVLGDAGTGRSGRDLSGLPDECRHELLSLPGQVTQGWPAQRFAGLTQRWAEREEVGELLGTFSGELVGQPGNGRRLAQCGDRARQVSVAGLASLPEQPVASLDEVARRQGIELVRCLVDVHEVSLAIAGSGSKDTRPVALHWAGWRAGERATPWALRHPKIRPTRRGCMSKQLTSVTPG